MRHPTRRALSAATTLLLAQAAGADITFSNGVGYPTPAHPGGIASGDFNHDGHMDLAITRDTPDRVSILMNNGDGTFAAPVDIPTGAGTAPNFIRAADIDGDGQPDLVVTLNGTNQILVLRNNGSGVFSPAGTSPVGLNPRWIAATRLDSNNTIDLVVANRDGNSITVLLNNGDLTFTPATYPVGTEPWAITVANLNHDSHFEVLVSCHGDRTIHILQASSAGALTPASTINLGATLAPTGIVAFDLNGDVYPDLAVATSGGGQNFASVFVNNNGTLSGPTNYPVGGTSPGHIAAVDIDRDGRLDLITVNQGSGNISTLSSAGGGTFAAPVTFQVGTNPQTLTIADFDGDTMPDIAVTNQDSGSTTVLINAGTPPGDGCYANCDNSSTPPVLNVNDFGCFLNHFAIGDSYANCDHSTLPPVLNVTDFNCFLNKFAAGCS